MNSFNLPKKPTLVEVDVGMTLREYFAALAMQAVVSGTMACSEIMSPTPPEAAAKWAINYADALIAALNEEPKTFDFEDD